jgi:hypothetical protein
MDDLPGIYGAACAAAADEETAGRVTERVVRQAGPGTPRSALVVEAVRLAVAIRPAPPFDRLEAQDRQALVLVRRAGMDAKAVAAPDRRGQRCNTQPLRRRPRP